MKANEFITEKIIDTLSISNQMLILISQHYFNRLHNRDGHIKMSPDEVEPVIRKLSKIRRHINKIDPGQQFWVLDHSNKICLGMRRMSNSPNNIMKNILGTIITPRLDGSMDLPNTMNPIINMS